MYEENLFIKDGIMYDTTDGCSKQYRFENQMCLLSVLAFTYIVTIDKFINSPDDGKIKIYGINGSDKS